MSAYHAGMTGDLISWEVVARGLVQGVYYRAFIHNNANELGVRGWVRKQGDGSVKAMLQHEDELVLARLGEKMRQGPPHANVTNLEIIPRVLSDHFNSFEIKH